MKNSIIISLVFQNSSATVHNYWFRSNYKVDDIFRASNDDLVSDHTEGSKDEDTNDAYASNEDNCVDKKNITIRKREKKNRKTLNTKNTKDHNKN